MEKFKIDKKNEEMIHEKPSLFAVDLKSEQDLSDYLEKNLSFQMFNKVDATTNNVFPSFLMKFYRFCRFLAIKTDKYIA